MDDVEEFYSHGYKYLSGEITSDGAQFIFEKKPSQQIVTGWNAN